MIDQPPPGNTGVPNETASTPFADLVINDRPGSSDLETTASEIRAMGRGCQVIGVGAFKGNMHRSGRHPARTEDRPARQRAGVSGKSTQNGKILLLLKFGLKPTDTVSFI